MQRQFTVPYSPGGTRLLRFLKERLNHLTTKELRWLVEHNRCTVNGVVERFCSAKLFGGEKVRLTLEGKRPLSFDRSRILFEDEALLVYNKPAALSSEEIAKAAHLLLVHRLDRDTTGVIVFAKTEQVQSKLEVAFKQRQVHKEYLAFVTRAPEKDEGEINAPLKVVSRREGSLTMGTTTKGGLKSLTLYKTIKRSHKGTLLLCTPVTGRTHQIRVHLASIGSPIYGDVDYGPRDSSGSSRLLLHAFKLRFTHPITETEMTWEIKPPRDFPIKFGAEHVQDRSEG